MKNELLKEIKNLEQTIYICEAEKLSPKALDRLRDKLSELIQKLSND